MIVFVADLAGQLRRRLKFFERLRRIEIGAYVRIGFEPHVAVALGAPYIARNEGAQRQTSSMSQLTVRNVAIDLVRTLKRRAAAHGRSAEAEHREILREALLEGRGDFPRLAKALRQRLRSTVDSTDVIRADRDRDAAR